MNKSIIAICVFSFFTVFMGQAQIPEISKGFLIIHSSIDYNSALKIVEEASEKLDIEINLRGYMPDEILGLKPDLLPDNEDGYEYIARGRWDDGIYLSIEYSNSYKGFTKGYYIVVLASGNKGDDHLTSTLEQAQEFYSDAYVKNTLVYIGCTH